MNLDIFIVYILWNFAVFALYGIDKWKAKTGRWRISENALILSAFFMGGVGALFGMRVYRHKTKHIKFNILVPSFMILNILFIIFCIYKF